MPGAVRFTSGSPWPSAARAHGMGSCPRTAGSSSGRPHCSQAEGPQHRLCHSWRWESFPECDAETRETVNERRALREGWVPATGIPQGDIVSKEAADLETGQTRKDHHRPRLILGVLSEGRKTQRPDSGPTRLPSLPLSSVHQCGAS